MSLQNSPAAINAAYDIFSLKAHELIEQLPGIFRGQLEAKLAEPGTIHMIVDTIDRMLTAAASVRVAPTTGGRRAKT